MVDTTAWNVLVVDDEPDSIDVVKYILEFHNAQVRTADSGADCLEMLRQEVPSFVLLDVQMPRMSGWDVLKTIREESNWRNLPVIAVTAHVMEGDRERILQAGFDGYIPKPVSPFTLVDELKAILQTKSTSK
jgi:two-component system cell cycle response regulator DivK